MLLSCPSHSLYQWAKWWSGLCWYLASTQLVPTIHTLHSLNTPDILSIARTAKWKTSSSKSMQNRQWCRRRWIYTSKRHAVVKWLMRHRLICLTHTQLCAALLHCMSCSLSAMCPQYTDKAKQSSIHKSASHSFAIIDFQCCWFAYQVTWIAYAVNCPHYNYCSLDAEVSQSIKNSWETRITSSIVGIWTRSHETTGAYICIVVVDYGTMSTNAELLLTVRGCVISTTQLSVMCYFSMTMHGYQQQQQ